MTLERQGFLYKYEGKVNEPNFETHVDPAFKHLSAALPNPNRQKAVCLEQEWSLHYHRSGTIRQLTPRHGLTGKA